VAGRSAEVRRFLRTEVEGWEVSQRGDGHFLLIHTHTGGRVPLACSPSCPRWRANTLAAMRRTVRFERADLDRWGRPRAVRG
jgi:hypothetical protein